MFAGVSGVKLFLIALSILITMLIFTTANINSISRYTDELIESTKKA